MAKNHIAKQKADAQAKEERDRQAAEKKAKEEERAKAADTRGRTSSEWRKWVEKQRWMKKEVIEVIKADKATRTGLRTSMRLITRNMGQVTNSKETILRVVSHTELRHVMEHELMRCRQTTSTSSYRTSFLLHHRHPLQQCLTPQYLNHTLIFYRIYRKL